MIKILMKIDTYSTFLKTFQGEIYCTNIGNYPEKYIIGDELCICSFTYKYSTVKFKNVEEYYAGIFKQIREHLIVMIDSYAMGFSLANYNQSFIKSSEFLTVDEWVERQKKHEEYQQIKRNK